MLAAITEQKRTVKLSPDNELTVRGLNLEDFAVLLNTHEEIMVLLFGGGLRGKSGQEIGKELLVRFPSFAYLCIALAADEPDCAQKVAQLPFPVQVELFATIADLTMPEGFRDGAKKIASAVALLTKPQQS